MKRFYRKPIHSSVRTLRANSSRRHTTPDVFFDVNREMKSVVRLTPRVQHTFRRLQL
jgi:hypothetical protein